MERIEYKDMIDFTPLKVTLTERGVLQKDLAEMSGMQTCVLSNIITGRTLPNTEQLARICAALQCSADKVVQFTGYEVKDRFKTPWDKYGCPRWSRVTYEPLRMLFREVYQDGWKSKLIEFYNKIPRAELTDGQKVAQEKRFKGQEDALKEKAEKEGSKNTPGTYRYFGMGLSRDYRLKINDDRAIPLPRLYDICKALHCTPDWVMTYN